MNDLLILCYHAVDPDWPADLSVTPDALEAKLAELARRGYRGARFSDACSRRPQGRVVAITFDDSYRSVLELAKPLLARHGFPGTMTPAVVAPVGVSSRKSALRFFSSGPWQAKQRSARRGRIWKL